LSIIETKLLYVFIVKAGNVSEFFWYPVIVNILWQCLYQVNQQIKKRKPNLIRFYSVFGVFLRK